MDSKGNPSCLCYVGQNECRNQGICNYEGNCVCKNGGTYPNCNTFCSKNCGKYAYCLKNLEEKGEENCICFYGGLYPKCKQCAKECADGEICALDEHGSEKCICQGTGHEQCPLTCDKDCKFGKCVVKQGEAICICPDGSSNYPDCNGPCHKKECPNGKCITLNGEAKCACKNGDVGNYPSCKSICEQLKCETNNGYCGQTQDGVIRCICKNRHNNYPQCGEPICNCKANEHCIISGRMEKKPFIHKRVHIFLLL